MKSLKIIIITTVFLVFSVTSYAKDIREGTIEISGDLDISFTNSEDDTSGTTTDTDVFNIDLSVASYIDNNLGVGAVFEYLHIEAGSPSTTFNGRALGPLITYNVPLDRDTSLKLTGAFLLISGSGFDGDGFEIQALYSYFITDSVSINSGLSFQSTSIDDEFLVTTTDTTNITAEIGVSIYIN